MSYESALDKQIREAQERGEFESLPGAGKPLPGAGQHYDEDWWLKSWVHREKITGLAPATLLVKREAEDLLDAVARCKSEQAVRELVSDLNARIVQAQRGLLDGPPVYLDTFDEEEIVKAWFDQGGRG